MNMTQNMNSIYQLWISFFHLKISEKVAPPSLETAVIFHNCFQFRTKLQVCLRSALIKDQIGRKSEEQMFDKIVSNCINALFSLLQSAGSTDVGD